MAESNKTKQKEQGVAEAPAQRFEIFTPKNPDFAGERAGVTFYGGTGRTDNAAAADECRRLGYAVRDLRHLPKFEVRTPPAQPAFTGEREGLSFFKGVARTDDEKLADKLADAGYEVLEVTVRQKQAAAQRQQ